MLDVKIGRETCHIHIASVSGKKFFHKRCMSWSYRNRGYDARTHRNEMVNNNALIVKLIEYSSGK